MDDRGRARSVIDTLDYGLLAEPGVAQSTPISWEIEGELQSCGHHLARERFDELIADADGQMRFGEIGFAFAIADPLLSALQAALVGELESPSALGPLYVDMLGDAVAFHLLQRQSRACAPLPARGGLSRRSLRLVLDTIEDVIETGVSLADLARAAGLGRSQFSRAFRSSTGYSAQHFLRNRRIDKAKRLLTNDQIAIAEVDCSFASQTHLIDRFRTATGLTPLAFRRNHGS